MIEVGGRRISRTGLFGHGFSIPTVVFGVVKPSLLSLAPRAYHRGVMSSRWDSGYVDID